MAADKDRYADPNRPKVVYHHPELGAVLRGKAPAHVSPIVDRLAAHPDAKVLAADLYLLAKEVVFDDRALHDALTLVGDIFDHGGGPRKGAAR